MSYRWIITKVNDVEVNSRVGMEGPRGVDKTIPFEEEFRMGIQDCGFDTIYYGQIGGDYSGFEPLDDLGEPDYGCNEIQYLNKNGQWEEL